jgi:hypothetical protein
MVDYSQNSHGEPSAIGHEFNLDEDMGPIETNPPANELRIISMVPLLRISLFLPCFTPFSPLGAGSQPAVFNVLDYGAGPDGKTSLCEAVSSPKDSEIHLTRSFPTAPPCHEQIAR